MFLIIIFIIYCTFFLALFLFKEMRWHFKECIIDGSKEFLSDGTKFPLNILVYFLVLLFGTATIFLASPYFLVVHLIKLSRAKNNPLRKEIKVNSEDVYDHDEWEKTNETSRISFHKSLPFSPNEKQVIFIAGSNDEGDFWANYVEENYQRLKKDFANSEFQFTMLSLEILEIKKHINEIVLYQNPETDKDTIISIKRQIEEFDWDFADSVTNKEEFSTLNPILIRYLGEDAVEGEYLFSCFELPLTKNGELAYSSIQYYRDILNSQIPRYRIYRPEIEDYIADEHFDKETTELMEEIKKQIELLRQRGVSEAVISSIFQPSNKLSRLKITSDFRIFLPDYNNLEIKMTPLPKAVFLLFLRHEEGILFKSLSDYSEELLEIYQKIKKDIDRKELGKSIAAVTDPCNNSINEKCARIREAFVQHFDERLAQNYFVTGSRGEAKKIVLSRDLVEWENTP